MVESAKPLGENKRGTGLLAPVLCLGLSALAVVPFFFMGKSEGGSDGFRLRMPVTHDMILHFDQMKSFYTGLASGEVYPRWEEDTNRGFGAPTTSYYPPGVYYLTSGLYAIAGDWMVSLLIAHLMMMVGAAAAVYVYARRLMNRGAAIAAMVAYIFLPYHLVDQYQRGAMAELLGFVFTPLMLLFGEQLLLDRSRPSKHESSGAAAQDEAGAIVPPRWGISSGGLLSAVGLAVTLGAFLWSHPPTAYQFMMAFGLFLVLFAWMHQSWMGLLYVACAITLGLGLSAAYVYPAFVEQDLIRWEFLFNKWPYHSTYVFASHVPYNAIDFSWIFNTVAILIGAVTLLALERHFVERTPGLRLRVWLWVVVGCFASFMMTGLSYPLGRLIPEIDVGVFAWRMLAVTTLLAALLAGACTQAASNALGQSDRGGSNSLSSLASLIIVGGALFTVFILWPPVYRTPTFSQAEEHLNVAMMPASAPREPLDLPKLDRAELARGEGRVEVERWDPEHRVIRVELSAADKLLIRTFSFPGWSATVDGEPTQILAGEALRVDLGDSEALIRGATFRGGTPIVDGKPGRIVGSEPLGDIVIELPSGVHRITLDYLDTSPRRAGAIITVTSVFLLLGLMLVSLLMRLRH
jgi:dolichyl-phosphate-mannose-protein mannosyltransferase